METQKVVEYQIVQGPQIGAIVPGRGMNVAAAVAEVEGRGYSTRVHQSEGYIAIHQDTLQEVVS